MYIYEDERAPFRSLMENPVMFHIPRESFYFGGFCAVFFFIFQIFFLFQGRFLIKKPSVLYVQTWAFHPSNTHTYIPTAYRQTCRIDMRRAERTIDVVRNKEPGPVPARPGPFLHCESISSVILLEKKGIHPACLVNNNDVFPSVA